MNDRSFVFLIRGEGPLPFFSTGRTGHRAARQVFQKPPFTPKTVDFRLATCEWPVYTQLRTLAPTSAMTALWWEPTLHCAAFSCLERRFLTWMCGTPTAGSEERNLSGSFPAPILAGPMSAACPIRPADIVIVDGGFRHKAEVEKSGKLPFNVRGEAPEAAWAAEATTAHWRAPCRCGSPRPRD